jgi:hypothetical protein
VGGGEAAQGLGGEQGSGGGDEQAAGDSDGGDEVSLDLARIVYQYSNQ